MPTGRIHAANAGFAPRAGGEDGEARSRARNLVDFLPRPTTASSTSPPKGKAGAAAAHRPGPGRRRRADAPSVFLMLDDVPGRAAAARTSARISTPCSKACRSASRWPTATAASSSSTRPSAAPPASSANERRPGPAISSSTRTRRAVSDAVRRFGRGRRAVGRSRRPAARPIRTSRSRSTVAGARGLGNAAVLLSLKDNSEEARLKREIAQATKMQAVGQLAGGVAHDFNNILTAIIGTCDLMLMRHTPGDSDYDDIQQIRSNSNRAANLTRQLLAFSRQQTLRPQVLQLPDVVAEVSHLLTRLLGERVKLEVKHGRGLGPVRADPGQLEQVIVNLAVNARDAMLGQGSGRGRHAHAADLRRLRRRRAPDGQRRAAGRRLYRAQGHRHRHRHPARRSSARSSSPSSPPRRWGRGPASASPPSTASSSNRAASSSPRARSARAPASPSICPSTAPQPGEAAGQGEGQGEGRRTVGHRHDPAGRGRGDGPRRRRARADPPRLHRARPPRMARRRSRSSPREGRVDLMISDVVMPTMDGPTTVRAARKLQPGPADPVHVGLCRGAAAQVDRHPQRLLPRQALLGAAARRDGPGRAGGGEVATGPMTAVRRQ